MAQPATSIIDLGQPSGNPVKRVLNVGCGSYTPERLHAAFRTTGWSETRLDIDSRAAPDIVSSITDLNKVGDATFDAIWCSHNLEHLYTHEVPKALAEFRRVLKADGFALITSPDLEAIAELVVNGRIDDVAYQSPAGPITALDMLYGLSASVALGNLFMSHHTGFTADRLGRLMADNGFAEVLAKRGGSFDLWALGLMPKADKKKLLPHLRINNLDMFPEGS